MIPSGVFAEGGRQHLLNVAGGHRFAVTHPESGVYELGVFDIGENDPAYVALGQVVHDLFLDAIVGGEGIAGILLFQVGGYHGIGSAPPDERIDGDHVLPCLCSDEL
ncbi:hypothetical protein SDC9_106805 [bioreactor metagenome]|uniref:Uncharacterized protein n=1 Tax=bioreactor metagenome TaxID=1076179 RepID=A0A645B3F9_9ZZZZ